LRVALDGEGHVVSSHADVAVIVLASPVHEEIQLLELADTDFQLGEWLTVVGYGYDEVTQEYGADRRFSRSKALEWRTPAGETVRLEQTERDLYRQDSGGPCLREAGGTPLLVGISSRSLGEGATCVGIHGYKDWILGKIQGESRED
jgi:hypothetical protein